MNKFLTSIAVLGSLALGACATSGEHLNTPPANHVSKGEYFVYKYPGSLPHVEDSVAAVWDGNTFDQIAYLDRDCRTQMNDQLPSAFASVGTTVLRTAIPTAILGGYGTGKGIGSVIKGAKAAKQYTSYGRWAAGGSAAGSGLGGGIDRHLSADRNAQAGCMNAAVTEAKRMDGALKGIDVVFNTDAINGKSLKRPPGISSTGSTKSAPDPDADAPNSAPH